VLVTAPGALLHGGSGTFNWIGNTDGATMNTTNIGNVPENAMVVMSGTGVFNVSGSSFRGYNATSNDWYSTFRLNSPGTLNIIGDIFTSGSSSGAGINNRSTCTVNITGSVRGGTNTGNGLINASSGIINLRGDAIGGADRSGIVLNNGTLNMIGKVIKNTSGNGFPVNIASTATAYISTDVITTSQPVVIPNSGTLYLSGTVLGNWGPATITNTGTMYFNGLAWAFGVSNNARSIQNTGTLYFTGTALGGNGGGGRIGIVCSTPTLGTAYTYVTGVVQGGTVAGDTEGILLEGSNHIVYINGLCIGGATASAVHNNSTNGILYILDTAKGGTSGAFGGLRHTSGISYVKRVVGSDAGPLAPGSVSPGIINSQNGQVYVEEVEFGAQGASPVSGPVFMLPRTNNLTIMNQGLPSFIPVTLFRSTNYPGLVPPASSVRLGTVYGNGDFTGTMVVPSPDSVQLGVAVDSTGTVGRAALSPITVWNFSRNASLSAGSIGERLRNAATTQAVGSIVASFNLSS
jgi:hypothetical protein